MGEREIFIEALQQADPAGRLAYVDRACGVDADLRRRVLALLAAFDQAGSFLQEPAVGPPDTGAFTPTPADPSGATAPAPPEEAGTVIGPYKLLEAIGEGGMGTVFMAEQTHPVRRRVALKIIKAGMDTRRVIARFAAERQALALMDHPNIARVLDAGATDTGRPYFVMELVRGVPITRYCDEHRLTLRQRLDLFIPVCQAVQHAHQKGIIHRDLKPSNVLVAPYDGVPVPKVIDFGVAKAAGPRLTEATVFTEFGAVIGTPEYMSPEQAELNQLDIDTRSDIYSLGVLLYELLTGSTPLERSRLGRAALLEVLRLIREEEPPRPSTRLSMTEELPSIAACRGVEPRRLSYLMRGELDWIVMKALEKDRSRRYETATGLWADLRRYLDDEPVQACPPSAWYRFTKSARRNRVALTTAGLVAGALLLGLAVSIAMAARARAAERRTAVALGQARDHLTEADRQRTYARKAVDEMYTQVAEKWLSRGGDLTPLQRDFLEKALAFYEEFAQARAGDAEARAEAAKAAARVGEIRSQLGETAGALKAHDESLAGFRFLASEFPDRPEYRRGVARSLHDIGRLHDFLGQTHDAERSLREALALRERLAKDPGTPDDRAGLAASYRSLGDLLKAIGRGVDGEQAMKQSIDLLNKLVAEHPRELRYQGELADSENDLGAILYRVDRNKAEEQFRRALELRRGLADADPADPEHQFYLARAYYNLGCYFREIYRPEQAVVEYRLALPVAEKLVADHPERPRYRSMLADTFAGLSDQLVRLARFDEAEDALRRSRDLRERLVTDFPDVPLYRDRLAAWSGDLGVILAQRGRNREAREAFERAYEIQRRLVHDFPDLSVSRYNLAAICYQMAVTYATLTGREERDVSRARELAREAVKVEPREPGFWKGLALAEYRAGDLDAALKAETKALELRKGSGYAYDWLILALIHLDRGDREQARAWSEKVFRNRAPGTISGKEPDFTRLARESEPPLRALLDADAPQSGEAPSRPDEQEKFHRAAVASGEVITSEFPQYPGLQSDLASQYQKLAEALFEQGKTGEAKSSLERSRAILEGLVARYPENRDYQLRSLRLSQLPLYLPPFVPLEAPERILNASRRAVELKPEDPILWKSLALAEYRNGHWDAAIEGTRQCIELLDGKPDEFHELLLALSHGRKGEVEPARSWYDRAAERIEQSRKAEGYRTKPIVKSLLAEAEELLDVSLDVNKAAPELSHESRKSPG